MRNEQRKAISELRRLKPAATICTFLFALCTILFAETITKDIGGGTANFLSLGGTARVYGLGRAFTGISDDSALLYYNPAGAAILSKTSLALTHIQLFEGTRFDNVLFSIKPHERWGLGVGIINMQTSGGEKRDENNNVLPGELTDTNNAVAFANGFSIGDKLFVGGTLKIINKNFEDINTTGFDADLGALYDIFTEPKISLGLAFQNLLGYSVKREYVTDKAKMVIRPGIGAQLLDKMLVLGLDAEITGSKYEPHFGIEANIGERASFRFGYDNGNLTAGLGFSLKNIKLDYALLNHSFGLSHRATLTLAFARKEKVREKKEKLELNSGADGKINLAVVDFKPNEPVTESDASFITSFFRQEIIRNEKFNMLDKNNMDKILAEQAFQQTGCTTEECIIQMGNILNVNYIMTGQFGKLGEKYLITLTVTDVKTAKIIYSDREKLALLDPDLADDTVKMLLGRFFEKVEAKKESAGNPPSPDLSHEGRGIETSFPLRGEERGEGERGFTEEKAAQAEKIDKPAEKISIAIIDFIAKDVSGDEAAVVSDIIRKEFTGKENYTVLEKTNMDMILALQGSDTGISGEAARPTECMELSCAGEIGKKLNVRQLVAGSFSKIQDSFYIAAILFDIENNRVLKSEKEQVLNADDISEASRRISERLITSE